MKNHRYEHLVQNRIYCDEDYNKCKKCVLCNKIKPCKEFFKKPALTEGFDRKCKQCRYQMTSEYEKSPKCKMSRKEYYYFTNYKLTYKDIEQLKKQHNYKCDICNIKEIELKRKLNIDHCHKTGIVRGLLCDNCNKALGSMKDSIIILENAIKYLKDSEIIINEGKTKC